MKSRKKKPVILESSNVLKPAARSTLLMTAGLLVLVPLVFSTGVYRVYVLPRLAVLLFGASGIVLSLALTARDSSWRRGEMSKILRSPHVLMVCLYLVWMSAATALGVAPRVSLFGTVYNQMGFVTHLCFFVCFLGLIVGVGADSGRLKIVLGAMAISGAMVSAYAVLQALGLDPFVAAATYTVNSPSGPLVRSISTLGHSNSLGNFLLYTTPVSVGIAIAVSGIRRWLMAVAVLMALGGILFSGTRGAWVGLAGGAITFLAIEMGFARSKLAGSHRLQNRKKLIGQILAGFIIVAALVTVLVASPASGTIGARARSFISDGLTGSGRTLLWRDSIKMIPGFALTGCGPEGFRRGFLAYRSKETARLSPQASDESSHDTYMDEAISYGLPGLVLYSAIIASTLSLLLRTRRLASDRRSQIMAGAIASAFVAVLIHNIFIYDQISNGLYFVAIVALAEVMARIEDKSREARDASATRIRSAAESSPRTSSGPTMLRNLPAAAGCIVVAAAAWYSISLLASDGEIKDAVRAAEAADFDGLVRHGERAASDGFDPAGTYDFLFVSLLTQFAVNPPSRLQANANALSAVRSKALEIAIPHIGKALSSTVTPELDYVSLAYLALAAGDADRSRTFASEAIRYDPNSFEGHWLLAESLIRHGDRDQAGNEAAIALELNPSSSDARAVLARATGEEEADAQSVGELIERGRKLAKSGDWANALRVFDRAMRRSNGRCLDCHVGLATAYEEDGHYEKAVAEWQMALRTSTDQPSLERISRHIDELRKKGASAAHQ